MVRGLADFILDEEVMFEHKDIFPPGLGLTDEEFYDFWNGIKVDAKAVIRRLNLINPENTSLNSRIFNYIKNRTEMSEVLKPDGSSKGWVKWPTETRDMALMSLAFRDVMFILDVEDEDSDVFNGGYYREYYLNGKIQIANGEVVFEDFDEKKLVPVLDHA